MSDELPAVEAERERVDPDAWSDVIVVGDVHGCREPFERLLGRLDDDALKIVVGDLVRKGPDSHGVVDLVRTREDVLSVRGNNEQKILDGRARLPELTAADREFIGELPAVIAWGGALVVHGGIDPRKPAGDHTARELLTVRSLSDDGDAYERPFWFEERAAGPRVFFGHTVLSAPVETPHAVGLDTGCVYGGRLTAYRCSTGDFRSVETATAHEPRSADEIVSPPPSVAAGPP
jgi:serine/threonine protein phosphatase 1